MKHITGYWIDEFNNRWNDLLFTEEQAEAESKTLKNCKNIEGLAGKFEMMGRHRRDYSKLGGRDGKRNEIEN